MQRLAHRIEGIVIVVEGLTRQQCNILRGQRCISAIGHFHGKGIFPDIRIDTHAVVLDILGIEIIIVTWPRRAEPGNDVKISGMDPQGIQPQFHVPRGGIGQLDPALPVVAGLDIMGAVKGRAQIVRSGQDPLRSQGTDHVCR